MITFVRITVKVLTFIVTKFQIHGVLNVVSWGILMPIGVMIARYLKVFESADPAWLYLHASCQTTAYVIGVPGVATGIKLGNNYAGVEYTKHRIIGVLLFILATLQVYEILPTQSIILILCVISLTKCGYFIIRLIHKNICIFCRCLPCF